jgi:hypothetical protein
VATPLYERVLGDAWTQVAGPVRSMHDTRSIVRAHGCFRIVHGRHGVARFVAWMLRLPPPSESAEMTLMVTPAAGGERWHRMMNGRRFDTRQYESRPSEMAERYGVLEFRFRLDASSGGLLYVQRQTALRVGPVCVRIPVSWGPRVEAREDAAGPGRVSVAVRACLPRVGMLIAYDGIISVEHDSA